MSKKTRYQKKAKKKAKTPVVTKNLSPWEKPLPYLGLLLVLTAIAFYPSLLNGFTNWDDPTYVTENAWVLNAQWGSLWTEVVSLNYHPLSMISLGLDHSIWGLNPFGYHLSNLLLHLCNVVLVYFFVRKLAPKLSIYVAFFTALLFGIHPMHVESVAWISERKDVLYVLFFMAGLWTYLRYLDKKEWKWLMITFVLFTLSVLSKAMAVVFPIVLLLVDFYRKRPLSVKIGLEKIPFLLLSIIFGWMAIRIQSNGAITDLETLSFFQRIIFAGYGAVFYIFKAFVPVQLSAYYPYPDLTASISPIYYAGLLIAIGIFTWPILQWRKDRLPAFSLGFYLITVALVLQLIAVGKAIVAERYSYLPYVGIFFLLTALLDRWAGKNPKKQSRIRLGLGIFSMVLLAICFQRNAVWENSETLWRDVIEKFPDRGDEGYANLGSYLGKQGRIEEAIGYLQKAVEVNPLHAKAHGSLGNAYGSQGKFQEALTAFNAAIAIEERANFYVNRAITHAQLGKLTEAENDFAKAIALEKSPVQLANIHSNRGFLLSDSGKIAEAQADCQAALNYYPNDPAANYCMATVLAKQDRKAEALSYAQKAQQLGYAVPPAFMQQLQ